MQAEVLCNDRPGAGEAGAEAFGPGSCLIGAEMDGKSPPDMIR